jgi:hypothetical protein
MPTDHRATLAKIKSFPQLITYLRDEMDWPIARDSFEDVDDLFYDFTPEELGIDTKSAAKIQEIKRLRPLSINQPWGIFFVMFEPKRLPVVALRRILSQVTLKKRASANSAERAAWSADDLLFISNYGEEQSRHITFAHFSQNKTKKDLPTLKVLGWDNLDTARHLDHVADQLTERLAWPDDEENTEEWGKQWRSAFTIVHREVITTSKKLSIELAVLARNIRARINTVLAIETKDGSVSKLMAAFKEALVHDLDEDSFADMYAQTIAYGLLSARVANPSGGTADDIAAAMPVTNPFLKELMEAFLDVGGRKGKATKGPGLDFDELGVGDVVDLLDAANMEAVVRDFGDKNPQEDPVIHFYELFLKEYDSEKRMSRGVFYTPLPVVSFIVRSVDDMLRTEFGLDDGLADITTWGEMTERIDDLVIPDGAPPDQAFVQILDPATGTGTFLVEVIDIIFKTMKEKWEKDAGGPLTANVQRKWNDYVPKHLLPRLHGYELMMAPYAIAHMKIGLKLYETGYRFESDHRARVYLTNALEPAKPFQISFEISALAREAKAVNSIKRNQIFTVIIGNPPYSFRSSNKSKFILSLLDEYRKGLNERKPQLNDDYVKFLRLAQYLVSISRFGIIAMITNNSYLYGITHRIMRKSLCETSSTLTFVNLGGDTKFDSEHHLDENVFEIRQGVCIGIFVQSPNFLEKIKYTRITGSQIAKYKILTDSKSRGLKSQSLEVTPPHYFTPDISVGESEYNEWPSIPDLFPSFVNGIVTSRDAFCIDLSKEQLAKRLHDFSSLDIKHLFQKYESYGLRDNTAVKIDTAKKNLSDNPEIIESCIAKCSYRPFDERFIAFDRNFIHRTREAVMEHLDGDNIGLIFNRNVRGDLPAHFFVTRHVVLKEFLSSKDNCYVAPVDLLYELSEGALFVDQQPSSNLSELAYKWLIDLGWRKPHDDCGLNVLKYVYSVFYSPGYRDTYRESIISDFPRLPLTKDRLLFDVLIGFGDDLIGLHLLESSELDNHITKLVGTGDYQVEKISYSDKTVWIDKAQTKGIQGVPEKVWNFHIGGYQVCHKWLKDRQAKGGKNPRPGRILTDEDIDHYQKIVVALSETIRIMTEIDEVIDYHGGWPGAFQVGE